MTKFASGTAVPVERSKAEIESTLKRYGASAFAYSTDDEHHRAIIAFRVTTAAGSQRGVKMTLTLPVRGDFIKTTQGRSRTTGAQELELQKAIRQRWRALCLVVKAKLEAVESGISTFETEWLAYLVLPNGKTVGETALPEIDAAYASGKTPPLLGLSTE